MPLRGLLYFSQLYLAYLNEKDVDIFGKTLVKIPTPRFLVFYNGDKKLPDVTKFRLSEAFIKPDKDVGKDCDFEWTATVVNINKNCNKTLHKKCVSLYHYSSFVARVKDNLAAGMDKHAAVVSAVDFAIINNYLDGFFKRQREDIIMFSMTEFDQEAYDRHRRREGYEDGAQDKAIEAATNLLKMKILTPEQIAQAQGLPLEQVLELQKQISEQAVEA